MPANEYKGRRKRTFEVFQTRDAQGRVVNCMREIVPNSRKPKPTFHISGVDEDGVIVLGYAKTADTTADTVSKKWGGGDKVVIFGSSDDGVSGEQRHGPEMSPGGDALDDMSDDLDGREGGQDIYQWFGEAPARKSVPPGRSSTAGGSVAAPELAKGSKHSGSEAVKITGEDLKAFVGADEYVECIEELEESGGDEPSGADFEEEESSGDSGSAPGLPGAGPISIVQQDIAGEELLALDEELERVLEDETVDCVSEDVEKRLAGALAVDLSRPQDADRAEEDYVRGELPQDTVKIVPASTRVKRSLLDFLYGDDAQLDEDGLAGLEYEEGEEGDEEEENSEEEDEEHGAAAPERRLGESQQGGLSGVWGGEKPVFDDPDMQECLDFFDDAPSRPSGRPNSSRPQEGLPSAAELEELPGGLFPIDDMTPDELASMESRIEELRALAMAREARDQRKRGPAGELDSLPPIDSEAARRRLQIALQSLEKEESQSEDSTGRVRREPTIADVQASVQAKAPQQRLPYMEICVSKTGVPLNVYGGPVARDGGRAEASATRVGGREEDRGDQADSSDLLDDLGALGVVYTLPSTRPAGETPEERRERKRVTKEAKRGRREAKKEFKTQFQRERQSLEAARKRERCNLQGIDLH